jgi:hypothetical protein
MDLHLHSTQGQVFRSPSRFRTVVAGRRWGKTRLAIAEILKRVPSRRRLWYVAPTYDMARDVFWRDFLAAIPSGWVAGAPNETRLECWFRSGCMVQCKSADNPDALRGRGLDFVVPDEYQDMDPTVWTDVLAPSLLDTNGEALFLGTPKSFNHLHDAYQRGQDPSPQWKDWASWQFRSLDAAAPHGHLDPNLIEMFRQTLDERSFRQEFEASFEALAGRVYYGFARATHVKPVALTPRLPVCVSVDFNIEPACAVIAQVEGQHVRVWREVKTRHAGGEATRATARRAKQLLDEVGVRGPIRIYGDATGKAGKTTGPADHAVLREVFPGATWCIPTHNPHVRDRVASVNGRCQTMTGERYLSVDPTCVGLIADLEQVIFAANGDIDKTTNPELTHLSDALGYLCAQVFPTMPRVFSSANFV